MRSQFAEFPKLPADSLRGARLGAGARPLPFQHDLLRHKTFHRVGHVGKPRAAAYLAIRINIESNLTLFFESGKNSSIFNTAKLIESQAAFGMRGAGFENFRRAQQAADLFGSKAVSHSDVCATRA